MTKHLDHFKTIRVLYLKISPSVTGAMVQERLCTLPNLRIFSADEIHDRDLCNDPRPWVCVNMEEFHLGLELAETTSDETGTPAENEPTVEHIQAKIMFLQRVSSLKYVRWLDLYSYHKEDSTTSLDIRLGHGSELLSSQ